MRTCKHCLLIKPADDFYKSNVSACKECVRKQVRSNRLGNIAYYRNYDRQRYRDHDHRKIVAQKSANSEAGVEARKRSFNRMKEQQPEKYKARNAVSNALRDGKIKRAEACFFCSGTSRLQAHHSDYSRPLDVHWLCSACHGKLHSINGDFLRSMEIS